MVPFVRMLHILYVCIPPYISKICRFILSDFLFIFRIAIIICSQIRLEANQPIGDVHFVLNYSPKSLISLNTLVNSMVLHAMIFHVFYVELLLDLSKVTNFTCEMFMKAIINSTVKFVRKVLQTKET